MRAPVSTHLNISFTKLASLWGRLTAHSYSHELSLSLPALPRRADVAFLGHSMVKVKRSTLQMPACRTV
jgi:hypothetical protein